jgi:AcrR family transcriptional regulator
MGISERREREKTERRKAILSCARELILSDGVQHVSMENIARKAELSKATVYLYFSSKDVLFNEICEDAAKIFLSHLTSYLDSGISGMTALKCFWLKFVELFGNFEEMIIVFQVRNFIYPGQPAISLEDKSKSPNVNAILETMRNIIEQCKAEGVFDSSLDSSMATRLILSMFSVIIENAARIPPGSRNAQEIINEMTEAFQILIRGFAKEGVDRARLDIKNQ